MARVKDWMSASKPWTPQYLVESEAIAAAHAEGMEEAAKIAESARPAYPQTKVGQDNYDMAGEIAKRIRSRIKDQGNEQT